MPPTVASDSLFHHPLLSLLFTQEKCDALFLSKKETIYYLSGLKSIHPLEREAFLCIKPEEMLLCHTPFVSPPKRPHITSVPFSPKQSLDTVVGDFFKQSPVIGFEQHDLSVAEYEKMQHTLPHASFLACDDIIKQARQQKTAAEIRSLKRAGIIAKRAVETLLEQLTTAAPFGITEKQLAHQLEHQLFIHGAQGLAFPTIVAFGAHTALPHHQPSSKPLTPNTPILIDCGATYQGFHSDISRSLYLGPKSPPSTYQKIKILVHQAYEAACKQAGQPLPLFAGQIDAAARSVISSAGFGHQFIHSTGHGIGLEAHELPHISYANQAVIQPSTSFTIEPGIYLPHQFGYRHEDTYLRTKTRLIKLT